MTVAPEAVHAPPSPWTKVFMLTECDGIVIFTPFERKLQTIARDAFAPPV